MTARIATLIACLIMVAGAVADAASVEVDILKLRNGRLYFDAGTERYIFADHRFAITCSGDTITTGTIERSFDGLSYGTAALGTDLLTVDSCVARIEIATVDSTSTIVVGLVESAPHNDWQVVSCRRPDSLPADQIWIDTTEAVVTRTFQSQLALVLAYENGDIDVMISPEEPIVSTRQADIQAVPAPYYFALIPDCGSSINDDGLLTTSMYYRFDHTRLAELTASDLAQPWTSLYYDNKAGTRPYSFDPPLGRSLLARTSIPVRRVGIAYQYDLLQPLAAYFGDMLARDRIRVTIDRELEQPELRFVAIPLYADRPWQSLEVVGHILARDTSAFSQEAELLRQTFERLKLIRQFHDQPQGRTYLQRTARSLVDDLGVFPLYRPGIYLGLSPQLTGVSITEEGRIDFCDALKLVSPPAGEAP